MTELILQISHQRSVIPHPSSLIRHPSSLIPHPSSAISHPSSAIRHPSSAIPHPPSAPFPPDDPDAQVRVAGQPGQETIERLDEPEREGDRPGPLGVDPRQAKLEA